jgi:hypothetical protein
MEKWVKFVNCYVYCKMVLWHTSMRSMRVGDEGFCISCIFGMWFTNGP